MKTSKRFPVVAALVAVIVIGLGTVLTTLSTPPPAAAPVEAQATAASGFVFEGCWAYFAAGPCYDIYRDADGNYWICKKCGETKKPSPGVCNRISQQTLDNGFWCS